ncbi:nitrate- and nitrite sensing domain-containing protein [Cellulomonas sp. Marseille-Q8402]
MLRRLGIRAKVLAVLAVPVLVLLLTAAYITTQSVSEARTAATVRSVVDVLPQYARTAEALQQERTLSLQLVNDQPSSGNLEVSRAATDQAVAALDAALDGVSLSSLDPRVAQAVDDSRNQQVRLADIRGRIDSGSIPGSLVDSNYTDIVSAENDVPVVVAETLSERSLASRLSGYGAIADTIEQVLRSQPVAVEVLETDGTDATEVRELASLFAVQDNARSEARTITNNLRVDGIQLPSRDADLTAMQLSLVSGNELTVSALDQTRWNGLVNAELAALRPVATDLLTSASERADVIATQAQEQAFITAGSTLAAAALSIVIAFIVARGIVVPMRRLTAAAGTVREELPRLVEQVAVPGESPDLTLADIPVESQDEVGRLAQAFNDVNATTIQVAREQAALRGSIAEMFVNVARRDQVLLGRQLAFIDSLERAEEDPATLANLFRLDHLATRMRRNAESLLVLAGIDSGRRLREAMPLSDVVRTASSEIEQYDRVQLELRADPLMHGFNALAAAHLLAELLENATLFSEPGTPVIVHTDVDGDHVVVRVVDQGLGMSPDEITAANSTIASTSPTEALGAQRLGLFVVARLAQRLGAQVVLERAVGEVSGTAAVVRFPVGLFTANDPALAGGHGAPQRSAAPTTGALPEVEAPVAVPVDLAALTDGATGTGLPRRRTADAPAAPAARSELPTEQDVVLPAPTETTLSPEIAAEASGWTPMVAPAPDAPASLPSRGSLPTRGGLPSRTPAPPAEDPAPVPALPDGPRGGLFSSFRGRDAVVQAADDQPVADDAPAVEPEAAPVHQEAPAVEATASLAGPLDHEPEITAEDHAHLDALSAPLTAGLPVVRPAVPVAEETAPVAEETAPVAEAEPEPEATPEAEPATLVVPGLVPDEPADQHAWSAWGQPAPAAEPESRPAVAEAEAQPEPLWAPAAAAEAPAAWSAEAMPVADLAQPAQPALPTRGAPIGRADDTQQLGAPLAPLPAPVAEPAAFAPQAAPAAPPAAFAPPAPFAQPSPVAQQPAPALPDFATLLQGDEQPEPARRTRQKRSFFSFRRKAADTAPAEQQAAAPTASPAQPAWPATSSPAGAPVPAVPAAPVEAPAPQVPIAPAASQVWNPSAAWAPSTEPVSPVAPAEPTWSAAPASEWGTSQQATDAPGWGSPAAPAAAGAYPGHGAPQPFSAPPAGPVPAQPTAPAWSAAPAEPVWSPAPAALTEPAVASASEQPAWASAPTAPPAGNPLPTRTRGEIPPPVPEPGAAPAADRRPHRDISAWASSWSPDGGTVPQPTPAPSWSAQPATSAQPAQPAAEPGQRPGSMGSEAAAMLALRADIQEQALSELSQLSAYRPQVDVPAGGSLTRRVPTAIPAAPEISQPDPGQTTARDADGLRDRLSSFQSGTRRGRRAHGEPDQGQTGDQPEPSRSESDHQPVPPSPSW